MTYRRILLKLSGEALMGSQGYGIDPETILSISSKIQAVRKKKVEIGLVVGGGNIFRGIQGLASGLDRVPADHMGMLATVINGIALQQSLEGLGVRARVMSALGATDVVEAYSWERALHYLKEGIVVIFVGGTGSPFFTTDTCASLRAAQIHADILLKATKVDGVYDKDPMKHSDAKRYETISYQEVIEKNLQVMDITAISMCREYQIPVKVFKIEELVDAVKRPTLGTLVS